MEENSIQKKKLAVMGTKAAHEYPSDKIWKPILDLTMFNINGLNRLCHFSEVRY